MRLCQNLYVFGLFVSIAVGSTAASVAHANLILNHSFEDDGFNQGNVLICPISGWNATCDGRTGQTQTLSPPLVGHASYLAIGSTGALAFVSQTVATVAGQIYRFTFDYSSDGGTANRFQALWDGSIIMDVTGDSYNPGWATFDGSATYSFDVTATSNSTTVAFGGMGDGSSFVGVDDVIVEAVPEPAILALFGLGLSGLAVAVRKRRKL